MRSAENAPAWILVIRGEQVAAEAEASPAEPATTEGVPAAEASDSRAPEAQNLDVTDLPEDLHALCAHFDLPQGTACKLAEALDKAERFNDFTARWGRQKAIYNIWAMLVCCNKWPPIGRASVIIHSLQGIHSKPFPPFETAKKESACGCVYTSFRCKRANSFRSATAGVFASVIHDVELRDESMGRQASVVQRI